MKKAEFELLLSSSKSPGKKKFDLSDEEYQKQMIKLQESTNIDKIMNKKMNIQEIINSPADKEAFVKSNVESLLDISKNLNISHNFIDRIDYTDYANMLNQNPGKYYRIYYINISHLHLILPSIFQSMTSGK